MEVIMKEPQDAEKVQLSTEQLVQIANSLQAQNNQMNAMVKDLGAKIAKIEVENSQLKAMVQSLAPKPADDGNQEEE